MFHHTFHIEQKTLFLSTMTSMMMAFQVGTFPKLFLVIHSLLLALFIGPTKSSNTSDSWQILLVVVAYPLLFSKLAQCYYVPFFLAKILCSPAIEKSSAVESTYFITFYDVIASKTG